MIIRSEENFNDMRDISYLVKNDYIDFFNNPDSDFAPVESGIDYIKHPKKINNIVLIGTSSEGLSAIGKNNLPYVKTLGVSIFNDNKKINPDKYIRIKDNQICGNGAFKPEIMAKATFNYREEIRKYIEDSDLAIIISGEDGGIANGIALAVGDICKTCRIPTIGIVSIPFNFQGWSRKKSAINLISNLCMICDKLVKVRCQDLMTFISRKSSITEAMEFEENYLWKVAETILKAVKGTDRIPNISQILREHNLLASCDDNPDNNYI